MQKTHLTRRIQATVLAGMLLITSGYTVMAEDAKNNGVENTTAQTVSYEQEIPVTVETRENADPGFELMRTSPSDSVDTEENSIKTLTPSGHLTEYSVTREYSADDKFIAYTDVYDDGSAGYIDLPDYFYDGNDSRAYKSVDPTMTQREFIQKIGSAAIQYYSTYRILPSMVIAQAIHESGWGKSRLSRKYHNYFGIKYCPSIGAGSVVFNTKEQNPDGSFKTISSKFCAWETLEQGIEGYYRFISSNQRYANLAGITDYKESCRTIKADGYATSNTYAQTLIQYIEQYRLYEYDNKAFDIPNTSTK